MMPKTMKIIFALILKAKRDSLATTTDSHFMPMPAGTGILK